MSVHAIFGQGANVLVGTCPSPRVYFGYVDVFIEIPYRFKMKFAFNLCVLH